MDNFSPPNIIPHFKKGDTLTADKLIPVTHALNRMNDGWLTPQVNLSNNIPISQAQAQEFTIVGVDPALVYAIFSYIPVDFGITWSIVDGQYSDPPLVALVKPVILEYYGAVPKGTQGIPDGTGGIGGNYLFKYNDAVPPAASFLTHVSYSNYSADGNARIATRLDTGQTEIQVIDPAYQTGYPIYATYIAQPGLSFDTVGSGGAFGYKMIVTQYNVGGSSASQISVPIPPSLSGTQLFWSENNLDSRHWVSQTVT